ncbi:MAG: radical SAM protein [Candidatus Nitrohelix vancouverensis]|uniref:Radical SAM protein n=1 Tax=Candidatus Nitrohelix vancouverensis TaxID=2705534 RepID=A0A7T0C1L4_9BACT|nr:MAG: radical SAM protein [Candidatus Nitrohelix vancouverensis]
MRILLLRPAAGGNVSMARSVPLGLLAIGSVLKREGHEVKILDLRVSDTPDDDLKRTMSELDPEVVGIGIMTIESKYGFIGAEKVKALKPDTTVIFGGPHCAHDPQYILNDPHVDYMVCGEGDVTIVELIKALEAKEDISSVAGIAYEKDGEYIKTVDRPVIRDLDWLVQEYDMLEIEKYFDFRCSMDFFPAYRHRHFLPIVTSRGCPFKCTYCHDIFSKTMHYRSPEVVIDEMEFLMKTYGVKEFHIVDDMFNLNMKRAKEVMQMIIDRGLKVHISFTNGLRADFFDDELIEVMVKAGVYRMALGVESGSQRIQDMIKKDLDIGIVEGVVKKLTRAKISVHGLFMLGFPSETREEMHETIDFACRSGFTTANFSLVIPNPGTELRETFISEKEKANQEFSQYSTDHVSNNASKVSAEELLEIKREAHRRFYFSTRRARQVWRTMEFKWLMRSALKTPFALLWRNAIAPTNSPTNG